MTDAKEAIERLDKTTREASESVALGEFRLAVKSEKVFLLDRADRAVWSCNVSSLDSRQNKKQLTQLTGQPDDYIDQVTAQLLFSLEQHEDHESQQIKAALDSVQQKVTLSKEQLDAKGLELLKSGEFLYKVKQIYDKGVLADKYRFVLREDDHKLLTVLNCVSSRSRWPQSEYVTGSSGFGKSNLVMVGLCLIPTSWSKILTYVTPAALRYSPNQEYSILFILRAQTDRRTRHSAHEK